MRAASKKTEHSFSYHSCYSLECEQWVVLKSRGGETLKKRHKCVRLLFLSEIIILLHIVFQVIYNPRSRVYYVYESFFLFLSLNIAVLIVLLSTKHSERSSFVCGLVFKNSLRQCAIRFPAKWEPWRIINTENRELLAAVCYFIKRTIVRKNHPWKINLYLMHLEFFYKIFLMQKREKIIRLIVAGGVGNFLR